MFPSNSTIQNPFADHFSSSLDENPSNFLLNFPPHLLDDDELLLGHFLQHHHNDHQHQQHQQQEQEQEQGQEQQHVPTNSGDEAAVYSALPEAAPEVKTSTTEKPKRGAAKSNTNKRKEKEKAADQEAAGGEQQKGTPEATVTGKKKRATTVKQPGAPRRRTGKKDRHSKIYTAQGPRDRRMRLSLQIARKFFDLQDMSGFDKASKTIEWLFTKSKAAIKDLTSSLPQKKNLSCGSASSATSECIGLDVMEDAHIGHVERSSSEIKDPEEDTSKRKTRNTTRKTTANQQKQLQQQQNTHSTSHSHPTSLARESRDKARARARQRTKEKMLQKEMEKRKQTDDQNPTNPSNDTNNNNNNNMEKFGSSCTTPETTYCDESAQEFNSSIEISPPIVAEALEKCSSSANVHQQALEHKMASVGIIEKLLGASSRSSSSIYDYTQHHHQHQPIMGIESMGLRSPSDHGFLGFSGHSWMAAESARMINGVTNPAGYGALMMNNGSNIMMSALQEQNPNSFFMTTSGSIYLQQPDHHHHHHHNYQFLPNQFSCNNASLDSNHDPSQL